MSRASRATRGRGLTAVPQPPIDNSQALRVGEGCAQAAGGCRVRAADRKPVPVRFQARDRARGRALERGRARNARARPRSARATSRPRACRLRGIRSRARGRGRGDTAARVRGFARIAPQCVDDGHGHDGNADIFFVTELSPPARPKRNSSKAEKMTAAVTAASAAALANPLVAEAAMSPRSRTPCSPSSRVASCSPPSAPPWWACPLSTRSAASKDDVEESIAVARALAAGTRPIDGPPTASRGVRRGWLVRVSSHTSSV